MYLPGATTIGLVYKDGVILSSEKRVSYGYMVMSKSGKKTFKITNFIGAACAGLIADMQVLLRQVAAYTKLYELDHKRRITVQSASKTIATLLFQRRFFPYITQTIIGGIDDKGPSIYVLDPLGSLIRDTYATVGSGAEIAIGVLEDSYRTDLSLTEGKDLIIRAMKSAIARDAASGNGIDLMTITNDGIQEESLVV
ncbi:MAG: archaeal proteasome endopeptidase complex subunit beta [Candidatus Bathyarchaeota archaeon]|nr:MAG: archaeal proteasome endopeptidase complex subunit beta [Candidatus Bathyarchaeota archaeon]